VVVGEVAARTGIQVDKVRSMLSELEARDISLDQPLADAPDAPARVDLLEQDAEPSDEQLDRLQSASLRKSVVRSALGVLDRREFFIVSRRLLAPEGDELSLAELGRQLGVSRERARQIEARARGKLRGSLEQALRSAGRTVEEVLSAA
jgi:RNA polymerase sigma-32 factor